MTAVPEIRLPSFNDFSPGILGDIRRPLWIVEESNGNRAEASLAFANEFFEGTRNKRSTTNVPVTLITTGLVEAETFALSNFGRSVLDAKTAQDAASIFVRELILNKNGHLLLEAISTLYKRRAAGSRKALLKRELENLGVVGLSNATTDHTTFENWMVQAGVVVADGQFRKPNNAKLKQLLGADADEISLLLAMDPAHRLFLEIVRRRAETEPPGSDLKLKPIYDECLRNAAALFDEDNLRLSVINPLHAAGWIVAGEARSGKGGSVHPGERLMRVPLDKILPLAFGAIPPDLRSKLTTPLPNILELLDDPESKYNRGLGLELLSLRMLLELGLEPRGFRQRAADTSYAEVDLVAEARSLLFSRWVIQCKNLQPGSNVHLAAVAKEVGVAIHQRAHVVVVVTTTDFTQDARKFAAEVTWETHLQVVLIPGDVVRSYLKGGERELLQFFMSTVLDVTRIKRKQASDADEAPDETRTSGSVLARGAGF